MITGSKKSVKSRLEWLRTWDEKKALSLRMAARLKGTEDWQLQKRGERMEHCADVVKFVECKDCGIRRIENTVVCRDRVCPLCSWRLANKRWVTLYNALSSIYAPGLRILFVTLTIKNINPGYLSEAIKNMAKAWDRLMHRKMIKHQVMGWARSVEVTYNHDAHTMHPHYHVIMIVESGFDFNCDAILDYWMDSVGKEGEITERVAQDWREIRVQEGNDLLAAALETYKYTIKQQDLFKMPLADFIHYARQIAGKRLTSTGGIIKQYIKTDLDEIDSEESDVCPACGSRDLAEACMEWAGTTYKII